MRGERKILRPPVGEKITKSRELESAGRESEGRDDDKCQAWVIGRRWRFWGEVFCPVEGVIGRQP